MNRLTPVSVAAGNGATALGRLGLLSGGVAAPPGLGGGTRLPGASGGGYGSGGTVYQAGGSAGIDPGLGGFGAGGTIIRGLSGGGVVALLAKVGDASSEASDEWEFTADVSLDSGNEGVKTVSTGFNQGRWIADIGGALCWVYGIQEDGIEGAAGTIHLDVCPRSGVGGGTRTSDGEVTEGEGVLAYFSSLTFTELGTLPSLVVPAAGTATAWAVVYQGDDTSTGGDDAVPIVIQWLPTDDGNVQTITHSPTETVDGETVSRCGYPVGVFTDDAQRAVIVYTLSQMEWDTERVDGSVNRDDDPTRRVRLLLLNGGGQTIDDMEVDSDTRDAGYSHSHFPSVAVSECVNDVQSGLVVWRSYYASLDDPSAIRGRQFSIIGGTFVWSAEPFDIAAADRGGVYASDPAVIYADGFFVVAFAAQAVDGDGGALAIHVCPVMAGGAWVGGLSAIESLKDGPVLDFAQRFPSLATDSDRCKVLVAYEVGPILDKDSPRGVRMAVASGPLSNWIIMPVYDGDGDGLVTPKDPDAGDNVDLVGDVGASWQDVYKTAAEVQVVNPCAAYISVSGYAFVGFMLRDMDRDDAVTFELYDVVPPI